MVNKKNSQNTMLAHSRAKVEFYEKYLERYLPIMSLTKYVSTINIYDVFCGRGVYENGGEGSPVRALKAIVDAKKKYPSNTTFILRLNDYDQNNIDSVKQYIAQKVPDYRQYCDVKFASVDAESLLDNIANWLTKTRNDERNLLFIDPYGYKTIHKDTIEKLMRNGKTEIILFLPVSFMHRFKDYAFDPEASESIAPLRKFTEDFFPEEHPMRNSEEEMNVHDYVDQYELDVVPERELQSWEIMNACYMEMLEHHAEATVRDREDYFKVLLALSIGYSELEDVQLSDEEIEELAALWKENYYEF